MLLSSGCRIAAGRTLLSSTLRQLSTVLGQQEAGGIAASSIGGHRASATSPSTTTSLSSSLSSLPSRRAPLSTGPLPSGGGGSSSSSSGPADPHPRNWHPTEEAESHSSVPEGATLAEEGGGGGATVTSSSAPRRNKKTPPRAPPSFDPIRTADALWPQSGAQRRVGRRVHRALQAVLSQPRSSTLPESVSRRLLGGGGGGFGGGFGGGGGDGFGGGGGTGGCGLALAGARASPDGKSVFVLYDCSPGAEEEARRALRAAAGPLRAAVSRVAGFKKVPKLVFVRDGEGGVGGRRESGGKGGKNGSGALPGRRRERSGGTVAEIEAEMARLGLLGGGGGEGEGEGGEEEEEEEEGWSEEEDEEGEEEGEGTKGSRL